MKNDVTLETSREGQNRERNVSSQYYQQERSTNRQSQYFISFIACDMLRLLEKTVIVELKITIRKKFKYNLNATQ